MIALLLFLLAVLVAPFRSNSSLLAENALLRHQVMVLRRKVMQGMEHSRQMQQMGPGMIEKEKKKE